MALLTAAGSSYSFKLRNSIEEEADSALSRLDDLIRTKGYEWLDDYMQGVKEAVAQGGRRNAAQAGSTLVNILKTPSRTPRLGTAKKTRTVLAREKDKENRLRLANAALENEVALDSQGSGKARSNPRSILFASALAEHDLNAGQANPIKHALPIAVKDTANPFIEPTSIVPPSSAPITISSSNKPSAKAVQKPNSAVHSDQALPSSKQAFRNNQHSPEQQAVSSSPKIPLEREAPPTSAGSVKHRPEQPVTSRGLESHRQDELTLRSLPTPGAASPERETKTPSAINGEIQRHAMEHLSTPTQTVQSETTLDRSTEKDLPPAVEIHIQHDQEMMSIPEFQDLASVQVEKSSAASSQDPDATDQAVPPMDDYSVPLKDDDVAHHLPSSPKTTTGTSVKSVFSPSAVTFAALPTRDLQRGRSIGASKHQRMTSHLVESTVPEVQTTIKTPGPAASVALPHPSENKAAISKAARDSKSGGTGAGSSWISRKVLGGSGGEDLRKSLAASKRPSTLDHPIDVESDREADELDDDLKQPVSRASEAPATAQRFSLATKTPQPPQHARQTLGTSTISRPVEQSQTNLSKMIADLQERRAVASFNASVTRATLPSLQLGRGAQGIAAMGISSGLLGRAALQASLDRTRNTDSQPPQVDTFDVFDEKPHDTPKSSAPDSLSVKHDTGGTHAEPSTTEELNQAVDEILRKLSTERQMLSNAEEAPLEINNAEGIHLGSPLPAKAVFETRSTTPTIPRTSSTRAEEQEVEELTKRTHAMSFTVRESEGLIMPGGYNAVESAESTTALEESLPLEHVERTHREVPASTTPVNSPPKVLVYRSSQGQPIRPQSPRMPTKQVRHDSAVRMNHRSEMEMTDGASKTVPVAKPLPPKTREQQSSPRNKLASAHKGLSQSQALSVGSDESEDSTDESAFEDAIGDKRFNEDEILADEVAKLARPLRLNSAEKGSIHEMVDSDSDTVSVEEVETNGATARVPSRTGTTSLASSTATNILSASTATKTNGKANAHTPANIARLIDGQKAPAGPINSILKAQQRKAEDEARRAKRVANKEAIEKRKQDERQAKLDEMRSKEEAERKARLERLRKQKAERERIEKKRQEHEAARAAESFMRDRATSVEPSVSKTTLNQSQGPKKASALTRSTKGAEVPRVKEPPRVGTLPPTTSRPPSRVSTVPAEIKGGAGAMRPQILRNNTNPSAIASQPVAVNHVTQVNPVREANARVSVLIKPPPPLTTSMNGNSADVRAVRPNKKLSIVPSQKTAPPRTRDSTMKPTRETMKPGMNVAEFQRMIALGGNAPANMRSEDIELSDIGSDFGYESDSSESDKGEVIPSWAQSPALRKAAATQEKINPSHLFGVMPEFKMEAVFDPKAARRPRSSSANWTGQDRLTEQEKLEYAKKMGYKSIDDLAMLTVTTGTTL